MKVDFKKELKHLYNPSSKEAVIVDVPEMNFLMVDGAGNPNTAQAYKDAVEALYAMSYAIKFMVKRGEAAVDYGVMPLEGLWWANDMTQFNVENKDIWKWTAMIMQPKYVTKDLFTKAIEQVRERKSLPALPEMRFESLREGLVAQIMHLGPYSDEGPSIEKLHNFIGKQEHELRGKHHEIYLTDPQKSAPEQMKTVIRQPVRK